MRSRPFRATRRVSTLGLFVVALTVGVGERSGRGAEPPAGKVDPQPGQPSRTIEGVITDFKGQPVSDALVVAGFLGADRPHYEVLKSARDGRFAWRVPEASSSLYVYAYKEGFAPSRWQRSDIGNDRIRHAAIRLDKAEAFSAVLVDRADRPLADVRVWVRASGQGNSSRNSAGETTVTTAYEYVERDEIRGSPLERIYETSTRQDGAFTLTASASQKWLKLFARNARGELMVIKSKRPPSSSVDSTFAESGLFEAPPGQRTLLQAYPAASIAGKVVSAVKGVDFAKLKIGFRGVDRARRHVANVPFGARVAVGNDGRFFIEGFDDGEVDIWLTGEEVGDTWTARRVQNVPVKLGYTTEVSLEIIRGVLVEGRVVIQGTGAAVKDVPVAVMTRGLLQTDAQGRFRLRVPPGEISFSVVQNGSHYVMLPDARSRTTAVVPEGVESFTLPDIEVAPAVVLHGRVVNARGEPVPHATIVGVSVNGFRYGTSRGMSLFPEGVTPAGVANDKGEFRLAGQNHSAPPDKPATLLVRIGKDQELEISVTPDADGKVTVRLPDPD